MTLPIFPQQAVDMLGAVNGRPYDAKANPRGLANGGHRQVFPDSLQAMVEGLTYTQQVALALEVLARLVETSATDAKAAKDEIIRIQGDTETFANRALAAVEKVEGAASMQMSDAGKQFVGLGTYDAMFETIGRLATNSKRGVVYFANESETITGTDDISAITPKALSAWAENWIKVKGMGAMDYSRTGWVKVSSPYWIEANKTTPSIYGIGSGEDFRYTDIAIVPVSDYRKCIVNFIGGASNKSYEYSERAAMHGASTKVTARLISNSILRLSTVDDFYDTAFNAHRGIIAGRWTVGAPS